MAAVDEISIKLGVKTGDLKAALADANVQLKNFGQQGSHHADNLAASVHGVTGAMRLLHHAIGAGGISAAVFEFFEFAITRAEQLKGTVDENAESVREFGENLKGIKTGFADAAVQVLGFFNQAGEGFGMLINTARAFFTHGLEGVEKYREAEQAITETAEAAQEAEARLAEARKKHGAEFVSITHEIEEIEKRRQEQQLKGLDVYETQANIQNHLNELLEKQASGEESAIERRRTIRDIAKTQLLLDEANLAVKKDQAAEEKKADELEAERFFRALDAEAELKKRKALDEKDELELFVLQQKRASELTQAERDRLDVLLLQRKEKSAQVEVSDLLQKKIAGELTPEETKHLGELIKQTAEIQKQIDAKNQLAAVTTDVELPAEEDVTDEIRTQAKVFESNIAELEKGITRLDGRIDVKGDVKTLSDIQLDQLARNLNSKLSDVAAADSLQFGPGLVPGTYKSIEQLLYQQNLDAVKREQDSRRDFERVVTTLGKEAAERTFTPEEFNRLSSIFNPDLQKQQTAAITQINATLTNLFPKQAGGYTNPAR